MQQKRYMHMRKHAGANAGQYQQHNEPMSNHNNQYKHTLT